MTTNEILDFRFLFEDTFGRRPNEKLLLVFWDYQEVRKLERELWEQIGAPPPYQEEIAIYGCLLYYLNPKNIKEREWTELPLLRADEQFNQNRHKAKVLHMVSCTNFPCLVRREGDICKGITTEGDLVCFEVRPENSARLMDGNMGKPFYPFKNEAPDLESIKRAIDSSSSLFEGLKEYTDKLRELREEKEREEKERANRWGTMSGTKITGKEFRESVNKDGINVEIITSEFIEDGKGYLLRRKEATVLQINRATFALIRQGKDATETLDNLQLTILPIDLAMDWG